MVNAVGATGAWPAAWAWSRRAAAGRAGPGGRSPSAGSSRPWRRGGCSIAPVPWESGIIADRAKAGHDPRRSLPARHPGTPRRGRSAADLRRLAGGPGGPARRVHPRAVRAGSPGGRKPAPGQLPAAREGAAPPAQEGVARAAAWAGEVARRLSPRLHRGRPVPRGAVPEPGRAAVRPHACSARLAEEDGEPRHGTGGVTLPALPHLAPPARERPGRRWSRGAGGLAFRGPIDLPRSEPEWRRR